MQFRLVESEEFAAREVGGVLEVDVSGLDERQRVSISECIQETGLVPFMLIASMRKSNDPLWRMLNGTLENSPRS